MIERVSELAGQELKLDDYFADFETRFWQVDSSWKLERCQIFQEPDVPSWAAMAASDRERSLALADEMRNGIAEHQQQLDLNGIVQHRVRIVELPLSDYLWWELLILRIRADLGERIRVLPPRPSPRGRAPCLTSTGADAAGLMRVEAQRPAPVSVAHSASSPGQPRHLGTCLVVHTTARTWPASSPARWMRADSPDAVLVKRLDVG